MNAWAVSSGVHAEHLYIHVPFCARRCVYCDFSIAVRSSVPVREYVAAIATELAARHAHSSFKLRTLYFGGGTPSKLGGDGLARLMDVVRGRASLASDCEVTLETNPEDVSPGTVRAWREAGVNRVSLGVQSFDDAVLAWMHRTHDSTVARRAIDTLRDERIENISIDLIFAVPDSLRRCWARDLDAALALAVPHLSLYGLTVEAHTPLGRRVARHEVAESPEEVFADQFLEGDERLLAAGLEHYEVSNYGLPGRHSRHNWAYWERSAYAGVGPSAHEFDGRSRRWNTAPYAEWIGQLSRGDDPRGGTEELEVDQVTAEQVYLNLRTNRGLVLSSQEREHTASWLAAGWASVSRDSRLRLTALGWLRLDSLAADLTLLRSRY